MGAFAACVCVALLTTAVWSVGKRAQQESSGSERTTASWTPAAQGMVDTTSESDLEALRSQGWALPGLAAEGYRIGDIRRTDVGGQPAVVLTLHHDRDTVTVVEQRGRVNGSNPVDGVTGLPVSAEGMEASAVSGSRLWLDRESWRAVMVRPDAVYTVASDTPPATMAQTVSAIVAEDRGRVSLPAQTDEGFGATVADGLRKIFG
ncbi:hypothetical protein KVA01_12950 [Kocuria varians]|uniref:Uncharacterized protein n=1 Tax=Kocuria varians TaxID=1272 RepID=A0A4Y4D8R0_KOCVA|nr:hypothetical protein [Kocuria varians]GEC99140.1 hypothetical protein KVA01_12950 [Kocuria varians]